MAGAVAALLALALPSLASAAEPPNQNDPCASGGRNTCGTTGVGSYERYRYGLRWFGDFRGVAPVARPTFCTDLRFWYPKREYRFREVPNEGFRSREGQVVSREAQRRMAYAIWNYGRSQNQSQQAAVMLYVHQLVGDGAPGELDPSALGPPVEGLVARISREAARLHGPYRIEPRISRGLTAGTPATGTVKLIAASGAAVPGAVIELDSEGVTGLPGRVRTGDDGVAQLRFTPAAGTRVRIEARSEPIASDLPRFFAPSVSQAARNGQRLVAPASQRVSATATQVSSKATISISTRAFPQDVLAGQANRDRVTVSGLPEGRSVPVTVLVHGPFRTREAIRCDAEPAARATFTLTRSGTVGTPVTRLARTGWYAYQLVIAGDESLEPVTTPCGVPAESFRVQRQPKVTTKVSSDRVRAGDSLTDTVIVEGLGEESATVSAALYGPFPSRQAIRCDAPPLWTGTVEARGDGQYVTAPVKLPAAGYYTYRESIAGSDFVRPTETACGDVAETSVAVGAPAIRTQVSSQRTAPGAQISDTAVVTGLGVLQATINVELWGPYPSPEAMTCSGTPYWTGSIAANGDGTYTTPPVTLDRAGYYTYRESIAATEFTDSVQTACGEAAETTVTTARPVITSRASAEVVRPGTQVFDSLRLAGLGKTPVTVEMELFGPFATRAAMRCTGRPAWRGAVEAAGDGVVRTAATGLGDVGFYTYRARIEGTSLVTGVETECGIAEETALAAPAVLTGRGDPAGAGRLLQAGRSRPLRVRSEALGFNTSVATVGIDLPTGTLDVPANVRRTAWWRDGAAPGDRAGAVLIAGHIDSARQGVGAFFRLQQAEAGDRIQVATADGRTHTYRVVSMRRMPKDRLPTDIYALRGRARLVLVTCGGRFDQAQGAYVDNVVVTAVPV
jgi:Sortase domain